MKILHILRSVDEKRALETVHRQAAAHDVTVLLLQDAVFRRDLHGLSVFACDTDVAARGGSCPYPTKDYDEIIDLIAAHDRVISW